MHAAAEPCFDHSHVPDAAAELNRNVDGFQNRADRVGIDRFARERTIEIDDVEPSEAGGCKGPCLRRGVVREDRRPCHVSLQKPHAGAVLEIDRGVEDHGAAPGDRSVRSLQ